MGHPQNIKRREEKMNFIPKNLHLDSVQDSTLRLLERGHAYQLRALRNSILANGYVPMERIIVVPYRRAGLNKYLVIEGNRRVAALKSLIRDAKEGSIRLSPEQESSFSRIPCAILESSGKSIQNAERVIMGIRHIAGPREWGAYQQAQLIYELAEEQGMDQGTIADHLGLSRVEVGRRYRALKALHAMENDEEYGEEAKSEFYRLFHELVSQPNVRERFGWNHEESRFVNDDKSRQFFDLIAPQDPDREPKLKTYADVRKLKMIIGNQQAEAALLDPDQSLQEALSYVARRDHEKAPMDFMQQVSSFAQIFFDLPIDTLRGLSQEDVSELESLIETINEIIDDHRKLRK
jgi:ParB-like chromosome segregation protein Spo0J